MSKFKRGNSTNLPSPSDGNIIYCKDTHQLLIDDSSDHNGVVAEGLNKNGYSASFDYSGNISFPKKVMSDGRDVTEVVSYDGTTTTLDLKYPLTYMTSGGYSYDVFSIGKYIKVTKQTDGSFLLENTSSSSTGIYYDNSIGICTSGDSKVLLSLQLKQKKYQSSSVYCKVIKTQFGEVQSSSWPSSLSSTTSFVSVDPPELQTGGYAYYYINVPYGCSCYVKNINISINDSIISQVIGYRGTLDPAEYHNIKSKTDKITNSFNGTSHDIIPFLVYSHTVSTSDWTGNTAKLPIQEDILNFGETPFILGYDVSSESDFDMCANAKITISDYPEYESGSYYYTITAYGEVPTKSIKIYYTVTIYPISI